MKGSPACNVLRSQEISFLEHACAGVLVIDPNDVMGGNPPPPPPAPPLHHNGSGSISCAPGTHAVIL